MWSVIQDVLICISSLIVYGAIAMLGIYGIFFGIKEAVKTGVIEALKDPDFETNVEVKKEKEK